MIGVYRKLLSLLKPADRRRFWGLVALSLALGLVETVGVASILPFLAVVSDPTAIERDARLSWLLDATGVDRPEALLPILGGLTFLVVISSHAMRAFTLHRLTRFTRMRVLDLATRLLRHYLTHPYGWFLGRNTAELGKTLLHEVRHVVDGAVAPAMKLLADVAVTLCIVGFLLIVDPVAALAAGVALGGGYTLIYLYFQRRLARMGSDRLEANEARFRIAHESLGGVKVVKTLNLEDEYVRRFRRPAKRLAEVQARLALISQMPQHFLEALGFGAMLLFVIWLLLAHDGRIEAALPTLGAFAFAGLRLFPAIRNVFVEGAKLRFNGPALDALAAELEVRPVLPLEGGDAPRIPLKRRLTLRHVGYRYPDAAATALRDVSLEIEARSTVGVVGATGAGKSTLIDVILGLLSPDEGEILADDTPITTANLRGWRKSIGYVPQTIFIADDTLAANIAFGQPPEAVDRAAVERAGRIAGLAEVVAGLPEGWSTRIGENGARLSGGQRQRVGIARALYRDPEVLVFDEATSALDALTEKTVMEAVRALGGEKTVILVAHRLSTVRDCDRIFALAHGRLVAAGRYDEVVGRSEAFRAIHEAAG